MGYYIEVPEKKGKAAQLVCLYGARIIGPAPVWCDIKPHEAVICVVDNGLFEAAGFAFDSQEFFYFKMPDGRPKTWLIMDWKKACELTGFKERR